MATSLSHAQLAASIKKELLETNPETSVPLPAPPSVPEPVNPVDLEERILQLCADNPKGITEDVIKCDQPLVDTAKRMKALQRLLSLGKLDVLRSSSKQGSGTTLIYRLKTTSSSSSAATKGFEREERLVYQIIEDSSNKGIWTRDIRIKSNLSQIDVSKILKKLESKQLIKPVKSVQASKKKVYMLYDLTPDESLTGGAWYSDQEFESEFVEVLNHHCFKFLQQKEYKAEASYKDDPVSQILASLCSTEEVCKFITELKISKVKLSTDDIQAILDTLVYDGKAEVQVMLSQQEKGTSSDLQRFYRASKSALQDTGFNRVPCGICPVISQCCDGGAISPATCVYMKDWLKW